MNILITAGGTAEPIDRVRSITNTGTGKLGSLIADSLAKYDTVETIFYIHARNSYLPDTEKAKLIPIQSTADLEEAVQRLCTEEKIHAAIHSMAVSDYRVRSVIPADALVGREYGKEEILALFDSENIGRNYNKLPSCMKEPVILLEQTPKILPLFRQFLPDALIVGFKLLDNVTHEELIDTAHRLLVRNGCDLVLANDYVSVESGEHEGFLIDRERNERRYIGKQTIADGIAETVGALPRTPRGLLALDLGRD